MIGLVHVVPVGVIGRRRYGWTALDQGSRLLHRAQQVLLVFEAFSVLASADLAVRLNCGASDDFAPLNVR